MYGKTSGLKSAIRSVFGACLVLSASFLVFSYCAELTVTFINVGQVGDSILIQTPSGRNVLIDGGLWYAGEKNIAPVLNNKGIKRIDVMVLTHPHGDHYGGLEYILKNFEVVHVLDGGLASPVEPYQDFLEGIKKSGAVYEIVYAGRKYDWGGCEASVLNARNDVLYSTVSYNNHSVVIKLVHGKNSFLFTGDIEKEAENFLLGKDVKSTVLKIPHHGSSSSSTFGFLKKVAPEVAVLTVGYPNDYGLPVSSTLEKYRQLGVKLYRTDIDGNVEVGSDGKKITVRTEKISKTNRYSAASGTSAVDYDNFWKYMDDGWFMVRNGKFEEAAKELEKAVAINPSSADGHSKLGYAYKKTGNSAAAEKEFLKAISLNDKEYYARIHLGLTYYYDERKEEALELFKKALSADPQGRYTGLLNEKIRDIEGE